MAKTRCGYCNEKRAKRYCPSLDKLICPICCGSNRLKNISCDESCGYLDNEVYQQKIRKERELKALLEQVPHSKHNDIFQHPEVAEIAYVFESFFADCYVRGLFNLTDQKTKETLSDLYYMKLKGKSIPIDGFTSSVISTYEKLKNDNHSEELIGKVILRIIISINKMTGGRLGPFGYLNYLKNNMFLGHSMNADDI